MGNKFKIIICAVCVLVLAVFFLSACKRPITPVPEPQTDPIIDRIDDSNPDPGHLIKKGRVPDYGQGIVTEPKIDIAPEPEPVRVLENEDDVWQRTVEPGELLRALSALNIRVASLRPIRLVKDDETVQRISIGGRIVDLSLLSEQLRLPSDVIDRVSHDGPVTFYGRGEYKLVIKPQQNPIK